MALTETALMGIACILTHSGQTAQTDQWAKGIDTADKVKVERLVEKGACLPASIESLLIQSKSEEAKKRLNGGVVRGAPSFGTGAGG